MKTEKIEKMRQWSIKHPVLKTILWYLFFPITIPAEIFMNWAIKWVSFKQIEKYIKTDNEHIILKICSEYMRFKFEQNKWKSKISKRWFGYVMMRHEKKIFNHVTKYKKIWDLNYFHTLMEIYFKYDIVGGATMNELGVSVHQKENFGSVK